MMRESKYPRGYAGSLKNKINIAEKKFNGLKTHDYHVTPETSPRIHPSYMPFDVLDPIIPLSQWFQRLCCKELKKHDITQLKEESVIILCKLERVFQPAFFTIMIHLLIHLSGQLILKRPVHYSWMFPIERCLCFNLFLFAYMFARLILI